jgi:hypothetical protein
VVEMKNPNQTAPVTGRKPYANPQVVSVQVQVPDLFAQPCSTLPPRNPNYCGP